MKYIIYALSIFPLVANAIELVKFQSDPEASSRQKFILNKKSVVLKKESNLFDVAKKYSLGTFEASDPSVAEISTKLEGILAKIKATDEALRSKGLSFNELSDSTDHHQVTMMLESFKILKNSNFYAEIDKLFTELQAKNFVHVKGIELGPDFKTINYFDKSKKIKSEEFNLKFSCKSAELPTICRIRGEGYLFL